MNNKILILIALFWSASILANNEYVINSGHRLFVTKTEHIRLILEPGTLLTKLDIPNNDRYRKRARVITPGGIVGEIKKGKYINISKITEPLAYLKRSLVIGDRRYNEGDIFKAELLEDENYLITYPVSFYSFKDARFYVREKKKEYKEYEFAHLFNYFDPENPQHKFPYWSEEKKNNVEWGCGKSKEETKSFVIEAGGEVKAGGSFFGFFKAEGHVKSDNGKTITYKSKLEDSVNEHNMSFWVLYDKYESNKPILDVALEKISSCDENKRFEYAYVVHFPKDKNIDPVKINKAWVDKHKLSSGGSSPVGLHNLKDYQEFKKAVKDFKFYYQLSGYDMNSVILDFLMKFTTNISADYNANK